MAALNWGEIPDGGAFESLMHTILYTEEPGTILFGRAGKDAAQDARSADGSVVYQAKYGQYLVMDDAIGLALKELVQIKDYRKPDHSNYKHWRNAKKWILVANIEINPNDDQKWKDKVVPAFLAERLTAEYWDKETLEGKLVSLPEIRDVFFNGENRVFVGLKEAHDLLMGECVGRMSFDVPMVGRDVEVERIKAFVASDKAVLPVVGPGGIGKSRLLYESLIALSQDGWRVLWAYPGSMARSSQWFKLLNGNQQTCVVIDNPDDTGILRAVIEQLATVERRKWRMLVALRSEKAEILRRYQNHLKVEEPLVLKPLDKPETKQLLKACLGGSVEEAWLHSVYTYTNGNAGWICLIAELVRSGKLPNLPASADGVASSYLDSCLEIIDPAHKGQAETLIRWVSLWGIFSLNTDSPVQLELSFMESKGVPVSSVRNLLNKGVECGLVRNWGVGKRLYAVEPLIIREHVLSSWLLEYDGKAYRVNDEGKEVVTDLIRNAVPKADKILNSLSRLSCARLDNANRYSFLQPLFENMANVASFGTLIEQYTIIDFVEKVGAADPERALDVLTTVRQTNRTDIEIEVPVWGKQTFSHKEAVAKIPWVLYQIAEQVDDCTVARRFLAEFRELVALEKEQGKQTDYDGKGVHKLLSRLLCGSRKSAVFAQSAREFVDEALTNPLHWSSFIEILFTALLCPGREWTEWSSDWTLTFVNRVLDPQSPEWRQANQLRDNAFKFLRTSDKSDIRMALWHILAKSHNDIYGVQAHGYAEGSARSSYRGVLENDLKACLAILESPPVPLSIEEATCARKMWSWYLEYGLEADPLALAKECEAEYNNLSTWHMQDFFQFGTDAVLEPETARVSRILRDSSDVAKYQEFFDEARRYLKVARQRGKDLADNWRISELADACADLFTPDVQPVNTLTNFVNNVLGLGNRSSMERDFAVRVCQKYLLRIKAAGMMERVNLALEDLLNLSQQKAQLLYDLYSNAHPNNIGIITDAELDLLLQYKDTYEKWQLFVLLGVVSISSWRKTRPILDHALENLRDAPVEASECLSRFLRVSHITSLRYETKPVVELMTWVIEVITKYGLNGSLLEMHDLTSLRDETEFRLNMSQLVDLIQSRIELEKQPKPDDDYVFVPHDFTIGEWCRFDSGSAQDVAAFDKFCGLALDNNTFVTLYWMPKYIAQIDPSGISTGIFIDKHLRNKPQLDADALARLGYLVSAYPDNTEAWAIGARLICAKVRLLSREQREHVFHGLSKKETGVVSGTIDKVPDYFTQERDAAKRLLEDERPESDLRPYREWRLIRAEADLQREREWTEEVKNG